MPEFIYTARTPEGALKKDRMVMKDEQSLANYLRNQGLILTSAKVQKKRKEGGINALLSRFSGVPTVQKIFFTQNLEVMVRTGFSLANALKTIAQQTDHKKFKEVILELQRDVESGVTFSNSLAKHPQVFSELFVNMIAAGEVSGKLDEVLKRLTIQMKKDHALVAKVKAALTYPAIVVIAMVVIGIAMMIFVIPQLLSIFSEANVQLPLPTRILIWLSNFLAKDGVFVLIGLIILIIIFNRLMKNKKFRSGYHKILLKTPIISGIIKKINLARFTRTLSSLLKTDIPIVQTFQIIAKVLGNVHYSNAMLLAADKVKQGVSIAKTLSEKPDLFPPIATQMISIGEESGTIDSISEEIANFYEESVDETMANLATIIEPVIMLILGVGVAVLAMAVILPIYSLSQTI